MTQKASPLFSFIGLALVSLLIVTVGCGPDYTPSTSTPASTQTCSSAAASLSNPLARTPAMALSPSMSSQHTGGGNEGFLRAIAAISDTDIWAVGNTGGHPLIEHWNGSRWSVIPNASVNGELDGVTMSSPVDAWAVGFLTPGSGIAQTLIEHWNGSAWSIVKSPNIGGMSNSNRLVGVAAISSNNVWAVGDFYINKSCEYNPSCSDYVLIEHWNGRSWNSIPSAQ